MAIFSAGGPRRLAVRLSTAAISIPSSTFSSPPHLSRSPTKSHIHKDHDPNKTLAPTSSTSGRFAVELAARRLSIPKHRESNPAATQESFLSTVILSYGSAHKLDRAIAVFEEIPRLCSAPPTALSFNALLSSAIRSGEHAQVPDLFSLLSRKHSIPPDRLSYGILVKSLCLSKKLEIAIDVVKEMEKKGIEVTTVIYTTVINSFYKEGKSDRAEEIWKEMVEKGRELDLTCYNVKIGYQAIHGKVEEVLRSVAELKADGLEMDRITYNYLMICCCKNGRYEDAKRVYGDLKSSGCVPNSTTFKIMLDLLCENGDFDAGFEVFKESVGKEKIPEFVTVRALVVGLAKERKMEEAKMVIMAMRGRFPANVVGGWKIVEKELGLVTDGQQANGRGENIRSGELR